MKEIFHNPPFGLVLAVTAIAAIIIFAILRLADKRRDKKKQSIADKSLAVWESQATTARARLDAREADLEIAQQQIRELRATVKDYEALRNKNDEEAATMRDRLRAWAKDCLEYSTARMILLNQNDTLKAELAKKDRRIKRLQNLVNNQRKYANY